jgi:transposase
MRFYTKQHKAYCGIDLHARTMSVCILNQAGEILVHQNVKANPETFLKVITPYRDDLVVAVECIFTWYWLADLRRREWIAFVLGHALDMKAIHGGKAKHDRIDAQKIAVLLGGGMLPQAYVYPAEMRATRDLLRRLVHLMRTRAELLTHIQNTNSQYNLPEIGKKIAYKANRDGVAERLILKAAKLRNRNTLYLLRTVPGIGELLSLVLLYELHDIQRFPRVQDFVSYCRLVKCPNESAGKRDGTSGTKIGNAYLKWAFSEAAVLFLRANPRGQKYLGRLEKQHGQGKALTVLAHKLARTVYDLLQRHTAFEMHKFFTG